MVKSRVLMIAPERRDCGIADYSRELAAHLHERVALEVFPVERLHQLEPVKIDADIVHLQYEHAFFLENDDPAGNIDKLFSKLQQPFLVTLHCLPIDDPRWVRWIATPRSAYHVHSREHQRLVRTMAPTAQVYETPLPIGERTPPGESVAAFRRRFGLENRRVIAIFGFIKGHKGYDVAIESLALLPADVTLLIAGGAQDADGERAVAAIKAAAHRKSLADRVRITGYLPPAAIGAALTAADVVVAPFHTVTASASLAMAMAWERPAVASALPQFAELEARFGCPLCVAPNSATELAESLRDVLRDASLSRRLVAAARRAREECSYDRVADTAAQAYRWLATQGRGVAC